MHPALESLTRSFRYRNYRLFFGGQLLSLTGTWITSVATSWLVFRLTGSTLLLGAINFASQFPSALLSPFGGVLVDRVNPKTVLLWTQFLSMIQSTLLAALTIAGIITVPQLFVLGILQGLINAFDMPARQVLMSQIVEDRKDLPNAIALNSAMFNGARLIGPSIGGIIIALTGEGVCFAIDAVSFLAVIRCLQIIDVAGRESPVTLSSPLTELRSGFGYVHASKPISGLLLLIAATCLFGTTYVVLLPVFAETIFHGGPSLLGFFMGASGLGAFLGAASLAARRGIEGLGRIVGICGVAFGLSIGAFAASWNVWLSMFFLFTAGFSMITMLASCNVLIQSLVDDHMRGRVMSFYAMAFMGTMPVGGLVGGWAADRIGVHWTLFISAVICIAASAIFLRRLPGLRKLARKTLEARGHVFAVSAE